VITTSATVPSLRPPPCEHSTHCAPPTLGQRLVFFTGIYLLAIGIGVAKAAIASFGAEQSDDDVPYFSWYYGVGNVGILIAGTVLVWVEDRVSWVRRLRVVPRRRGARPRRDETRVSDGSSDGQPVEGCVSGAGRAQAKGERELA
jgi:hypothetical protein